MDRIAVLIPCFNEERTIGNVVTDFKKTLPDAAVYVYDNNSNDRTVAVARDAGAIVRKETLQGKGNVIRRMFREVDAECYIMADGDDTYPADAAIEMVEQVLEGQADMVVGDRLSSTYFDENKRRFHNFGNALVRKSINKLFKCNIRDIMTGYRAFSYRFVKTFPVLSKGFEIETEMSIHAIDKNMNVSNVVVEYRDRPDGSSSKLNTFSDGAKVIRTIVSLFETYKPRAFFSGIALVLFLLAAVFFVPIFINFRKTGLVSNFPTLIVCGFTVIAGLQSFFSGIILHTLRKKDRQDFEKDLIRCQERYVELVKGKEAH